MKQKKIIFIGSSSEQREIAEELVGVLSAHYFLEPWYINNFPLTEHTLDSLFEIMDRVHYAVFVLTPDDLLNIRGKARQSTRDNVIFQFGLFLSKFGKKRVFAVSAADKGENHQTPSDYRGITCGRYEEDAPNIGASLGPFCTQVKRCIDKYEREEGDTVLMQPKLINFYNAMKPVFYKIGKNCREAGMPGSKIADIMKMLAAKTIPLYFGTDDLPELLSPYPALQVGSKVPCAICGGKMLVMEKRQCNKCKFDVQTMIEEID